MSFFLFRQNSTIYTDLAVTQPVQWWFKPFVSHLLAEGPGLSFSSGVAILPDVDGFHPILSQFDFLYRFSHHPPLPTAVLTFVSHLLTEDPGPSIPSVVAILPDFDVCLPILSKLNYLYRCSRHPTPKMPKITLCLPPARCGPRA